MQFWRPGDVGGPSLEDERSHRGDKDSEQSLSPEKLQFLYAVEQNQVVFIEADPEYDTVTQLPYTLAAAGWPCPAKSIAVALPKKVGVLSAALRLAARYGLDKSELGGDHVGYAISGNVRRSVNTKVVFYMCDSLISDVRSDPLLNSVSIVLVDEMHKRCISTDLVVALLRQIQRFRSDLRIILCGTTFNTVEAEEFFGDRKTACIQMSKDRHPVSIMHLREPVADFLNAALENVKDCFEEWDSNERPFDRNILIFVSGADEVEWLCQEVTNWFRTEVMPAIRLQKKPAYRKSKDVSSLLRVIPLHASVDNTQFAQATQNDRTQQHLKVVISTNLAESAVIVNGISTVVDCGFEKVHLYDSEAKLSSLRVVPISRASARQRATRAGKFGPGTCFRLYTQSFFDNEMSQYRPPEILRKELSKATLILKMLGIDVVGRFQFMTQPPPGLIADAVDRLYHFRAIDPKGIPTKEFGVRMTEVRLSIEVMKCVTLGEAYGLGRALAGVAAMLEVRHSVFNTVTKWNTKRSPFAVAEGDLLTLLNVWRRYCASGHSHAWCKEHGINARAMSRAHQFFEYVIRKVVRRQTEEEKFTSGRKTIGLSTAECVRRCIAGGFFENACMVQPDGSYLLARNGKRVSIHSSSVLRGRMPKWIVFTDIVHGDEELQVRDVTVVEPQWLVDGAPEYYEVLSGVQGP